jgi:hypothetical protein
MKMQEHSTMIMGKNPWLQGLITSLEMEMNRCVQPVLDKLDVKPKVQ